MLLNINLLLYPFAGDSFCDKDVIWGGGAFAPPDFEK